MSETITSIDPATGAVVWEGKAGSPADCARAVADARATLISWSRTALSERIGIARRFAEILGVRRDSIAEMIARETGKLLWETRAEVGSMIAKVEVSITAQAERAGERSAAMPFGEAVLRHRGHGVMAVLGPYNFPGHLPNGHIVPALLAGNVVVFKPSEIAPSTGEMMAEAWREAGLPEGVLTIVQGGRATGEALVAADIDGLLFTGSAGAGSALRRALVDRPHILLALELGGNNPLIVWDGEPAAAASIVVQSAFVTTGQRCSCARRLIVPDNAIGRAIVDATDALAGQLRIAAWNDGVDAFMGPLVSNAAAVASRRAVAGLEALNARVIRPFEGIEGRSEAFVTPSILDMTDIAAPDAEIFAPVLQIIRVPDFNSAIAAANNTIFGLSAGLVSNDETLWKQFLDHSRAGVVNRNRPTTGAAANMPFGGVGASGNHRPSAYYAADYAAYPVASFEAAEVRAVDVPGVGA